MAKFFSNFLFPDQYFSSIFFTWQRIYPGFFFLKLFLLLLLLLLFLSLLLLLLSSSSWLIKAVLKKISKYEWKQGIEKNSNNNYINITRNCTFVNFKNYTTLKTSKRIGFKLVLIISRSKERVFNSFKDFIWFFDRFCYPRWFKAIQN